MIQGAPDDAITFAERFVALLDGGAYTASYKFAVLLALMDCCLHGVDEEGRAPHVLSARGVADAVLERYWTQAVPYGAMSGAAAVPRQSILRRDLVVDIAEFRRTSGMSATGSVRQAAAAAPTGFGSLRDKVYVTVVRMPLPKLQRVGRMDQRFLFDIGWPDEVPASRVRADGFDDRIQLRPGVGDHLVRTAGLLRPLVEQRWANFVARRNPDTIERDRLHAFLFGAERFAVARLAGPLRELQSGDCFYCGDGLRQSIHVDHFLPWSRSADDGLDNLVAAHARCNGLKSDSFAAVEHLLQWMARPLDELEIVTEETGWHREPIRTRGLAAALYLGAPEGTPLWRLGDDYEPLNRVRARAALRQSTAIAAETARKYEL